MALIDSANQDLLIPLNLGIINNCFFITFSKLLIQLFQAAKKIDRLNCKYLQILKLLGY